MPKKVANKVKVTKTPGKSTRTEETPAERRKHLAEEKKVKAKAQARK
jgi:hypothetical protein